MNEADEDDSLDEEIGISQMGLIGAILQYLARASGGDRRVSQEQINAVIRGADIIIGALELEA